MFEDIFLQRLIVGIPYDDSLLGVIILTYANVYDASTAIEEPHDCFKEYLVEKFVVRKGISLVFLSDCFRLVDDLIGIEVGPAAEVVLTHPSIRDLPQTLPRLHHYLLLLELITRI